ncbi:hypothetical protein GHT06_019589 [Daphnia sinensis]|uniref:Uncharacterized protein n=1 Tax=Daphnia sinensis TaxID=1820382 RepID=A0AAD5KLI8_9CRUS|nr:hypothetical protein GHT06_019589 [Daphnia sinensis]
MSSCDTRESCRVGGVNVSTFFIRGFLKKENRYVYRIPQILLTSAKQGRVKKKRPLVDDEGAKDPTDFNRPQWSKMDVTESMMKRAMQIRKKRAGFNTWLFFTLPPPSPNACAKNRKAGRTNRMQNRMFVCWPLEALRSIDVRQGYNVRLPNRTHKHRHVVTNKSKTWMMTGWVLRNVRPYHGRVEKRFFFAYKKPSSWARHVSPRALELYVWPGHTTTEGIF